MTTMIILEVIQIILLVVYIIKFSYIKRIKENEYYTDYRHNNLVLRIFKPEFEYQAIGDLNPYSILDRGVFSKFYFWALIDSKHEKEYRKRLKDGNKRNKKQ